jgi:hypothetical protein
LKKPYLKDRLPNQLCHLCDQAFCINHKRKEEGVCEINHETYYKNHPGAQYNIYRMYKEWKRDYKEIKLEETSSNKREIVVIPKEISGKVNTEVGAEV